MDESLPYDILRFDYKERLSDRFLATHLHRFEMFNRPVAIAVVIEILNPWHPTSEVGGQIINSIAREFARRQGQSFLARFEASLKFTNPIIQTALAKLDTAISCVAMLIEADQVHCAGIGSARLGLQRNGRLAGILSGQDRSEVFSAVTSGDLREGDWLVLANQTFYDQIVNLEPSDWTNGPTEVETNLINAKSRYADQFWAGLLLRYQTATPPTNQTFFWDEAGSGRVRATVLKPTNASGTVKQLLASLIDTVKSAFQKISRTARPRLPSLDRVRQYWRPIAIGGLVVVAILIFSAYHWHRRPAPVVAAPTLAEDIANADPANRLQALISQYKTKDYQDLSAAERDKLSSALTASSVSLLDLPPPAAAASKTIAAMTDLAGEPIIVDGDGQVWLLKNNLLSKAAQTQPIPSPVSVAAFSETNIVVTDTLGNVWQLDGSPNAPTALPLPKSLPTTTKIVRAYQTNLYLIDPTNKITWRVANFTNSLGSAAVYNSGANLNIANTADLALNGSAIEIDKNGLIISFVKTKAGSISASLPVSDGSWLLSAVDGNANIVAASGRLVYVLDASGKTQKTFFVTNDKKITGLALDPTAPNTLWLSLDTSLYKVSF